METVTKVHLMHASIEDRQDLKTEAVTWSVNN